MRVPLSARARGLLLVLPLVTAAGLTPILAAERPALPNRAPAADEVGYRPADGAISPLNPPSCIWLHEPAAAQYAIELADNPAFEHPIRASGLPWNTYTPAAPLAPGRYYWRYRFTTAQGVESDWSQSRSVVVPDDAVTFPMPTPAQQRERVPERHPRLFLRPEDLPRLRAAAGWGEGPRPEGPEAARAATLFTRLRREAEQLLNADPTPEPIHRGSARDKDDAEAVKYWWPNRVQTLKACQEAETLAFVFLLTRDDRFGTAARRWILHLASWDPDGPTNFELNCEAAKPLLHRLSRAYDWAYEALTDSDREQVRKAILRRVTDAWNSWEVRQGTGHLNRPYGSHANRTWHKIGESGIAFLGEIPEAATWLDYAVNKFYAIYPVWSDDDGGWHEGVSYWAGYLAKVVWWLQVADSALGIDGLRKPFFAQVGDFPLYVAPPGSPNMGFGDLSHGRPNAGWGGFLEYFVRAKGSQPDGARAAHWRWWTEQWNLRPQDGILGFLYAANLPSLPPARPPMDLPTSKVFRGIGVASLHTTLLDSAEDVHFLFKSSPFGTQSHGHNPHNTFQLNAYGEALLTTCVYRDLHGSRFHYQWAHSTRAHNGVLIDGEGQIQHTAAPHGRLVAFESRPDADYVMGDATAAYGDRLRRYQRHAVLVKGPDPMVILFDDLEAKQPASFQFILHALAPFDIDADRARLNLKRPQARLLVAYQAGQPLRFRQWDGYEPAPNREFPNQWHVEASTLEKRDTAQVLTVLAPSREGTEPTLTTERLENASAIGIRWVSNGRARTVAFRKAGAEGEVHLDGHRIEGHFTVGPMTPSLPGTYPRPERGL